MLQSIRERTQGWVSKVIVSVIVLTFAIFGLERLGGLFTHNAAVATVNGKEISRQELQRMMGMLRQSLMAQRGKSQWDPNLMGEKRLRELALNQIINRLALLKAATDQHMSFSSAAISDAIVGMPQFQTDGRYDPNLFIAAVRNFGMTPMQFRSYLEQDLVLGQLEAGFSQGEFITDTEYKLLDNVRRQERLISYAIFNPSAHEELPSRTEIDAYYQRHRAQYTVPRAVRLSYLMLTKAELATQVVVSPAELHQLYQEKIQNIRAKPQKIIAHILIKGTGSQARYKADEVYRSLEKGASFEELARKYSADRTTAKVGGRLGVFEPGIYGGAYDEAVLALQPQGFSRPIKTNYGYEIVKRLQSQVKVPTFEQLKLQLIAQARQAKLDVLFVEKSRKLAELSYEAQDLQVPAKALGIPIGKTPFFDAEHPLSGILGIKQVVEVAFSRELLQGGNSELIEPNSDTALVVHLNASRKAQLRPLSTVKGAIIASLKAQKARQKVKTEVLTLLNKLTGQKGDKKNKKPEVHWIQAGFVKRDTATLRPRILSAAFQLPRPNAQEPRTYGMVELEDGSVALLCLQDVKVPKGSESVELKKQLKEILIHDKGDSIFNQYALEQRKKAHIKMY